MCPWRLLKFIFAAFFGTPIVFSHPSPPQILQGQDCKITNNYISAYVEIWVFRQSQFGVNAVFVLKGGKGGKFPPHEFLSPPRNFEKPQGGEIGIFPPSHLTQSGISLFQLFEMNSGFCNRNLIHKASKRVRFPRYPSWRVLSFLQPWGRRWKFGLRPAASD